MRISLEQETPPVQASISKKRSLENDAIDLRPSKRTKTKPRSDNGLSTKASSINHWRRSGFWPEESFEMDNQASLVESMMAVQRAQSRNGAASVAGSFTDQNTQVSLATQLSNINNNEYLSLSYTTRLADLGYFVVSEKSPSADSLSAALALLKHHVDPPERSYFDDDLFEACCKDLQDQNEARVVHDFGELIFPSSHYLFCLGKLGHDNILKLYSELWVQAKQITSKQPMPGCSVGFRRSAFNREQLEWLRSFLGDEGELSYFAATLNLLFPFMTCEVKRSQGSLQPADNANAHSMFIAVRAIVNLYEMARASEVAGFTTEDLHGQILAFSVSHNDDEVRIWGYYPFLQDGTITYHRIKIKRFFLQEQHECRWTAYRFASGVYEVWAVTHLDRIKKAINGMIQKGKNLADQAAEETESDGLHILEGAPTPGTSRTSLSTPTHDTVAAGKNNDGATIQLKTGKQKLRKR